MAHSSLDTLSLVKMINMMVGGKRGRYPYPKNLISLIDNSNLNQSEASIFTIDQSETVSHIFIANWHSTQ